MKELDFSLASTEEIIKELARRAKQKRKQNMHHYGDQKSFAEHIGMSYRSYQQFEINGKITLEKFVDVLRGLDALEESEGLLKFNDESLFEEKNNKEKSKPFYPLKKELSTKKADQNDNNGVYIPDVFSQL